MVTESTNIRIDKQIKTEAIEVLTDLGLSLSDSVNIFLRKLIAVRGIPFAVRQESTPDEQTLEARRRKFDEFLKFAEANPVFEKGFKFNRDECYDRNALR